MAEPENPQAATPPPAPAASPSKQVVPPTMGEVIISHSTKISYTMGHKIGEGNFGVVFSCSDGWGNELAAKVFKPLGTYEKVRAAAEAEFVKLLALRNPYITFVYDAFEFRDTFYIITERCHGSISQVLFGMQDFKGPVWLMAIARCLLQAVHYLHIADYVHQDIHPGNIFLAFHKDEMQAGPDGPATITFKLGD